MPVLHSKSIIRGKRPLQLKYSTTRDNRREKSKKIKLRTDLAALPNDTPLERPSVAAGETAFVSRYYAIRRPMMNSAPLADTSAHRLRTIQYNRGHGGLEEPAMIDESTIGNDPNGWVDEEEGNSAMHHEPTPSGRNVLGRLAQLMGRGAPTRIPWSRAGQSRMLTDKGSRRMEALVGSLGKIWAVGEMSCKCLNMTEVEIVCIDYMECEKKRFLRCKCSNWFGRLILQGYFPTAPLQPQTAISIKFLHYLHYTSTRGSFSKEGFAAGLQDFHRHFLLPMEEPHYPELFRTCIPFFHRTRRCRDDYVRASLALKAQQRYEEEVRKSSTPQEIPRPLTFQIGSFCELCPCCFYRAYPNDKSIIIICLDGNFQHRRYLHVANAHAQFRYDTRLFIDPHESMVRTANFVPPKEETLCASNFRATAAKPNSMRPYDETGLLAMVCRHDVPLRYMNLHAGERLLWVTDFIEKVIKQIRREGIEFDKLMLMYDIACQLDSFMKHKDHGNPVVAEWIEVVVNKFHGYAHEFRCHERWGADQKPGVGLSDGEGVERLWAFLRVLVVAGKSSSPANRKLFLELFGLRFAERKRLEMGKMLIGRFTKAQLARSSSQDILASIYGKRALVYDESATDGGVGIDTDIRADTNPIITVDLLRQERAKRAAYFHSSSALAAHDYVTVYDALLVERELEKRIEDIDEMLDVGVIDDDEHTTELAALDDINRVREETDRLLAKYKQSRQDWIEGGELWRRAALKRRPDQAVYDRLVQEKKAEAELRAAESSPPGPARRQKIAKARAKLARQRSASDKVLRDRGVTRGAWHEDGRLFERYHMQDVTRKLEQIYRRILQTAAARSMQLRELKGRSSGHNNSAKLVREIQKAYPGISADIEAFNKQSEEIKDIRLRPPQLSIAAFVAHEEDDDAGDKARESLFALHLLRTATLEGLENGVHGVTTALWARSELVRMGIRQLSKLERALEEIEMVKGEWKRVVLYEEQFLNATLDYLIDDQLLPSCQKYVAEMLWDELPVAQGLWRSSLKIVQDFPYLEGELNCPSPWGVQLANIKEGVRGMLLSFRDGDIQGARSMTRTPGRELLRSITRTPGRDVFRSMARETEEPQTTGENQHCTSGREEDEHPIPPIQPPGVDQHGNAGETGRFPTQESAIGPDQNITAEQTHNLHDDVEGGLLESSPILNGSCLRRASEPHLQNLDADGMESELDDEDYRIMLDNDAEGGYDWIEEVVDEIENLTFAEPIDRLDDN